MLKFAEFPQNVEFLLKYQLIDDIIMLQNVELLYKLCKNEGDILKNCYLLIDEYYTIDGDVISICSIKGGFAVRIHNRFCYSNPALNMCRQFVYTYIITEAKNIL